MSKNEFVPTAFKLREINSPDSVLRRVTVGGNPQRPPPPSTVINTRPIAVRVKYGKISTLDGAGAFIPPRCVLDVVRSSSVQLHVFGGRFCPPMDAYENHRISAVRGIVVTGCCHYFYLKNVGHFGPIVSERRPFTTLIYTSGTY